MQGVLANAPFFGHFGFLNALANSRLIASGRDGSSSCFAIHSSSGASSSGGSRTPTSVEPTGGRPIRFLLTESVDRFMAFC
jgi:hypothetical protein